jgi:hypothetical protein
MKAGVVTLASPFAIALLSASCSSGATSSGTQSTQAQSAVATQPVGHSLCRAQLSYVGHVKGGTGSYTAQTKVIDAQRSLPSGQAGRLLAIPGIGAVSVTCSGHPVADFKLTVWAQGEGPPTVTYTAARTHGTVSLCRTSGPLHAPQSGNEPPGRLPMASQRRSRGGVSVLGHRYRSSDPNDHAL